MNVEPTIGLALLAGFVSFISPCVLPLVPAYVGYMGGHATTAAGQSARGKFSTFLHGVFFVLGFTIFFVGFGLLTAKFAAELTQWGIDIPTILTRLGGVAVIFFGLYVMKALDPVFQRGLNFARTLHENPLRATGFSIIVALILIAYYLWVFDVYAEQSVPSVILALVFFLLTLAVFRKPLQQATGVGDFWYRAIMWLQTALISDTRRLDIQSGGKGYLGSIAMGIVFSAGWTPCIGPIYGSVLTLAADSAAGGDSLLPAAGMLTAYSLGLGIPFLVTALALNQVSGLMTGLKRNMRKVEYVSGALLILIGIFILTGSLEELSARFGSSGELGDLSVRLEACTVGMADGRIHSGAWSGCIGGDAPKLNDRVVFASEKPEPLLTEFSAPSDDESGFATENSNGNTPDTGAENNLLSDDAFTENTDSLNDTIPSTNRLFTGNPDFDPAAVEVGLEVGNLAPDFTTVTPDGEAIALSDYRGDIVLINFWATWCGPCRVEMPEFQNVYERYNERGFTVLAVDFLESPEVVTAFAEEIGVKFPLAMDESGDINDSYDINQYPTSYVIDGNGVIIGRQAGLFSGAQLLEVLQQFESE